MLLSLASVLALIAATVSSVAASPILATTDTTITAASTPSLPFNFTQIFTASLALGNASSQIPIPGGALINEPIAGGSVTGSAVNGTIQGGFAHPPIYNNGTLQVAEIDVYGVTSDGQAFYIHEEGVGSNSAQVTRIVSATETKVLSTFALAEPCQLFSLAALLADYHRRRTVCFFGGWVHTG